MSTEQIEKVTIWHKLAEHDLFNMFKEMHYNEDKFVAFQKKRLFKTVFVFLFAAGLAIMQPFFLLGGVALAIYMYWASYRKVKSRYSYFLFNKQMAFAKFSRMLIPYLLLQNATLYHVFNRMLLRIEDEHMKTCLERLIIEMNEHPNAEAHFVNFGQDAGGTDQANLFMTTLYDYQQNSSDPSIVEELGKMASDELFYGVDEIIKFKLSRFHTFPTRLTMINLIIIFGYMISVFLYLITRTFL